MPYTQRTWVDFVDAVDASNFNHWESRINSAASANVQAISVSANASTSGTLTNISSGTLSLVAGPNVTLSQNASTIAISAAVQTVQTQNLHNVTLSGNTAGALGAISSGTMTLAGGNNITVSQAGNAVTISGANAGGAQTGISSVAASNTTYTSGQVEFTGSNMVTVKSSANQRVVIDATQTVQTQSMVNAISYSDTTKSGTVRITGAGDITVASDANGAVVSGSQSVQPVGSLSPGGNTTGTTANLPFASNIMLAGGNNVTISQSSGTNSSRLTISAASQSVQPGVQHLVASDNTFSSGTVSVTGTGGGVTINTAASKIQVSVAAPVAQTVQTQSNIQSIAASNTTYQTGQVEFTGSQAATVRSSANQRVVIDVPAQTAQTQSNIQGIAGSNTTYNTGTVEFTGSNMVTVKSSANQRLVIDATQSVQPVGSLAATGNTTGTMATLPLSGSIGIAGGPNITISQSTGAASTNLSISAAAPGAGNAFTFSASDTSYSNSVILTGSNIVTIRSSAANKVVVDASQSVQPGVQHLVASDNTFSSGTVSITGLGNITVNTAASKIQISGPTGGGGGIAAVPVSNTTGTTANVTDGTLGIGGGNNITISQSSGTNSTRFIISAPNTTVQTYPNLAEWANVDLGGLSNISHLSSFSKTPIYFPISVPGNLTLNSVAIRMSNVATGTLQSFSVHLGIYSFVNSTSIALMGSASDSYNVSTASSASWSGARNWVLTSPSTAAGMSTLSPGNYVAGMMFSAGATGSMHFSLQGISNSTAAYPLGRIVPGANQASTGSSQGVQGLYGQGSTTVNALPANVAASEVRNQASSASAAFMPWLYIRS